MCVLFIARDSQHPVEHQAQDRQRIVPVPQFWQEQVVVGLALPMGCWYLTISL